MKTQTAVKCLNADQTFKYSVKIWKRSAKRKALWPLSKQPRQTAIRDIFFVSAFVPSSTEQSASPLAHREGNGQHLAWSLLWYVTVKLADCVSGQENCLPVHRRWNFKEMFLPPSFSLPIYSAVRDSAAKHLWGERDCLWCPQWDEPDQGKVGRTAKRCFQPLFSMCSLSIYWA